LLYPAVALMNRLSFGMKFSLISVLFLLPMLVTNFYLVRDSYREFQGTRIELQSLDLLGSSLACAATWKPSTTKCRSTPPSASPARP
jgi:methyl-accepting chemotaxis protein